MLLLMVMLMIMLMQRQPMMSKYLGEVRWGRKGEKKTSGKAMLLSPDRMKQSRVCWLRPEDGDMENRIADRPQPMPFSKDQEDVPARVLRIACVRRPLIWVLARFR